MMSDEDMSSNPLPVLWSFRRCPYAMRARLAIASSGVMVELREILLRDKPDAFVAVSPKATVPVLVDTGGAVLEESRDVMMWALSQNDPEGWLDVVADDPSHVAAFFDKLDGPFKTHLDRYKYASRYDASAAEHHRKEGADVLAEFDRTLQSQTALSGDSAGLLDYASLPFVRQFRIADPVWFDAQQWPHLHRWLGDFLGSKRFASVMEKYAPWQPGETGIRFQALSL